MRKQENHSISLQLSTNLTLRDSHSELPMMLDPNWAGGILKTEESHRPWPNLTPKEKFFAPNTQQLFCPCPGSLNDMGHIISWSKLPLFEDVPLVEI